MKKVASVPGSNIFRSIISIILVSIFVIYFINKAQQVSLDTDRAAMLSGVNDINTALSFAVYRMAINKNLRNLVDFPKQNPFDILDIKQKISGTYREVINKISEIEQQGWYFNLTTRKVVYHDIEKINHFFYLDFEYVDVNGTGKFETGDDMVTYLGLKKGSG